MLTRVDKGKAKMTAEQNERLENERAAERLLAQIAAEIYRSPEVPQAALLGQTMLSYERDSLGDRDNDGTCQRPPTDCCGAVTTPAGPQEERTVTQTADPGSVPETGLGSENLPVAGSSRPKDDRQIGAGADNNAAIPALSPAAFSSASQQPHLTPRVTRKRKRGN